RAAPRLGHVPDIQHLLGVPPALADDGFHGSLSVPRAPGPCLSSGDRPDLPTICPDGRGRRWEMRDRGAPVLRPATRQGWGTIFAGGTEKGSSLSLMSPITTVRERVRSSPGLSPRAGTRRAGPATGQRLRR